MARRRIWAAWMIAVMLGSGAQAQTATPTAQDQFRSFIASDGYNRLVGQAFAGMPADVFAKCPAMVSKGSQVLWLAPVHFSGNGDPDGGIWKQMFPIFGCGNDTTFNLFFSAAPGRKLETLMAVPGSTHADPQLQEDTLTYAKLGASVALKTCKAFDVKDTEFLGYDSNAAPDPTAPRETRPWHERWIMIGCGHTITVPIRFLPDATGTTIVSSAGRLRD